MCKMNNVWITSLGENFNRPRSRCAGASQGFVKTWRITVCRDTGSAFLTELKSLQLFHGKKMDAETDAKPELGQLFL